MSSDIEIKLKDLQEKMMEVLTVMPLPFSQPLRESFPLYKIFGENGDYYPKEKETILKWKNLSEEIEKLIVSIRQLNDSRVVAQVEKSK